MTTYTDRLLSYQDPIWYGFKHEGYTHGASMSGQPCGDEVEFRLIIGPHGHMEVLDVEADGCVLTECCAAMLKAWAVGRQLSWLDTLYDEDWARYVNVLTPGSARRSCMILPLECLRKAVATELNHAEH